MFISGFKAYLSQGCNLMIHGLGFRLGLRISWCTTKELGCSHCGVIELKVQGEHFFWFRYNLNIEPKVFGFEIRF